MEAVSVRLGPPSTAIVLLQARILVDMGIGPAACLAVWAGRACAASWTLASPDGRCTIMATLDASGALGYETRRDGRTAVLWSPLGLRRDDGEFTTGLRLAAAGRMERRRERYELFSGPVPRVDRILHRRTLRFRNEDGEPLELDLAASDQGVAFRYRFPDRSENVRTILSEATGFAVPTGSRSWLQPYHAPGTDTPAYEDFYLETTLGEGAPRFPPGARGPAFPALFEVRTSGVWVLLTESGTDGAYPACHLAPGDSPGRFRIAFPAPEEGRNGRPPAGPAEPRNALPWTCPWRVVVMGASAGAIATATLVTDLAPPSRIADTAWIRPGRSSLAYGWWPNPSGPHSASVFDAFSDFSAEMGWEYTLFDFGWWDAGLPGLSAHARSRGLLPVVWTTTEDFYDPSKRRTRLDELRAAGAACIKADYWVSDRRETMAAIQGLLADAAERRLTVNLHGCTIPRGWQRTWPNLLTLEGVFGEESYVRDRRYRERAAEHHATLPFTRNAVGPMDVMPVGGSSPYRLLTTAAHELAYALVGASGLVFYASEPEYFRHLPAEVQRILRDAPARWDETRCLLGDPGRAVVFARRAGRSWFIAGLNGTTAPLPVSLDLSRYDAFGRRVAVTEGPDPTREVAAAPLTASGRWEHAMPPRGGFILRLDR